MVLRTRTQTTETENADSSETDNNLGCDILIAKLKTEKQNTSLLFSIVFDNRPGN